MEVSDNRLTQEYFLHFQNNRAVGLSYEQRLIIPITTEGQQGQIIQIVKAGVGAATDDTTAIDQGLFDRLQDPQDALTLAGIKRSGKKITTAF